jgi:hypothetical protein
MNKLLGCLCSLTIILTGCVSEQVPQEQAVDNAYSSYQADQGLSDWQIEQDVQRMREYNNQYLNDHPSSGLPPLDSAQGNDTSNGCPFGCTDHKPGCDIKGNISFNTGEKIYHVPGGYFYDSTTIDPSYGEMWFCTEAEAIANGWRRSYK